MFFIASFLINTAVLWVFYQWAISAFPWLGRRRRGVATALGILWVEQMAVGWIATSSHGRFGDELHTMGSILLMAMGIAAGPIMLLRGLSWAVGLAGRKANAQTTDIDDGPVTRRQIVEGAGGLVVLGASGAVLGWGAARGRHMFELSEVVVRIPGLPRALDGYSIAQISDLHVGLHMAER